MTMRLCSHQGKDAGGEVKKRGHKKQFWLLLNVIHYSTAERRYEGTTEGLTTNDVFNVHSTLL